MTKYREILRLIIPARVRAPKDYRRKNVISNSIKDSQNTPMIRYL